MPQLGNTQLGGARLGVEDTGTPFIVGPTPAPTGPCKADIYFLCDNTGSMGTTITPIQAAINTLITDIEALATKDLSTFDVAFGVGNYNDFPLPDQHLRYGDSYDPSNLYSIVLAPGDDVTMPLGPGPSALPGAAWSGAATSTFASPITEVTIPSAHQYGVTLWLRGVGGGTGLFVDVVSDIQGSLLFGGDTFNPSTSGDWIRKETTSFTLNLTTGEKVHIRLKNNTANTISIYWSTSFLIYQRPTTVVDGVGGTASREPSYCYCPQADIMQGEDATVARAIGAWEANSGSDYAEGWLYALDRIAHGAVHWRVDSTRYVVQIGDSPPHTPVCTNLTGLGYNIDENTVSTDLLANDIILLGVSVYGGAGGGLDDSDATTSKSYTSSCGFTAVPGGQATYIANATGGQVLPVNRLAGSFSTDIVNAVFDIIEAGTLGCRIPVGGYMVQAIMVG